MKTVINLVAAGSLLSTASADDWPQWQGPERNAISKETGLLKEWPKDGPPLAWENHHGGVVLVDGCLFGANGGNGGGYPVSLDFHTGEVLWNEKDPGKRRVKKGSVAVADGRIYYRTEEGAVALIEPSRKEYLERGRFEQPDRTSPPAWAHPVIANGKLYIRDQDTLFCYDVKAK